MPDQGIEQVTHHQGRVERSRSDTGSRRRIDDDTGEFVAIATDSQLPVGPTEQEVLAEQLRHAVVDVDAHTRGCN